MAFFWNEKYFLKVILHCKMLYLMSEMPQVLKLHKNKY